MTFYAGPQIGDEKPIGGGENNKKNIGHEIFNFTNFWLTIWLRPR